jgi:hypothetical protein
VLTARPVSERGERGYDGRIGRAAIVTEALITAAQLGH